MWEAKNFQLHHDNAPAHSANVIQEFHAKMACHLFNRLHILRITRHAIFGYFQNSKLCLKKVVSVMRRDCAKMFGGAKEHSGRAISEDFPKLAGAMEKCVDVKGEYFEGD